ncbi:MAG TPA: GDSL-type esterase/lipase family protein [Allosphingosinicella sp.]
MRCSTLLAATALLSACASQSVLESAVPAAAAQPAPIPAGAPFRDEILRFAQLDRESPPPRCPVLFVGSSSIRLWESLAADMTPLPVLNRGFGGSTIADVNLYFDHVASPYRPRAIVFYAGENDLDAGRPPAAVAAEFRRFLDAKRRALGEVPVFFISAKPSKLRLAQLARQAELNAAVRSLARTRRDLVFIDIVPAMMKGGAPRDLYVGDGLHMAPAGYSIWRNLVRAALLRRNVRQLPCPR